VPPTFANRAPRRPLTHAAIAGVAVLAGLFFSLPVTLPGSLRGRLSTAIGERFGGSVDVSSLSVSVLPRLRVAGQGVVVRDKDGGPPLISIRSFSGEAGLLGLLGSHLHLREVRLVGLEINVPPGGVDLSDSEGEPKEGASPAGSSPSSDHRDTREGRLSSPIVVDRLVSEDAVLRILRKTPGKPPREFAIARLEMQDTGADTPWAFRASLTNPTPPGRIDTHGTFGPWNADSPARTALGGQYVFHDADLGVFKGISGTLQSEGAFSGVLERIAVDGHADVGDFTLEDGGHAVPLKTELHSIVDGTNGNTWLRPVTARFRRTVIHATGGVVEKEGQKGRTVALDVTMDDARLEDVLFLAVAAAEPPMSGALKLQATFELPPGHVDPLRKLRLEGSFTIDDARFRSDGIQQKVNDLSHKAKGEGDTGPAPQVWSDFSGRFAMRDGVIRFSTIRFAMPGARVDLNGSFAALSQSLDFRGTVRLDAKLSELTTGMKSLLLKLVEPVFRKKGVTVVPITVGGSVKEPKLGLDFGKALTPR
jgi:hypothetical protein